MGKKKGMDGFRHRRRKSKATYGGGGDFFRPEFGHTALLICPPTPDMEGCPYVEIEQHFGIAPGGGGMAVCLNPNDSSDLDNPITLKKYKDRTGEDLDLSDGCAVCERLDQDELPPELLAIGKFNKTVAENMAAKGAWYFGVVPMGMIRGGELHPFADFERVPRPYPAGYEAWDSICDVIDLNGEVWDLDAACLVVLSKDKGARVKYSASAFSETVKNPLRVPKPIRFAIQKAQKPGESLDLFRIIAGMIKSRPEVESIMYSTNSTTTAAGDASEGRPPCFGVPEQYEVDDPDCEECSSYKDCGESVAEQSGDDDPPKKKKRGTGKAAKKTSAAKKTKKPDPEPEEPEDDDGDDGEGDPDPDPPPPKKKTTRTTKSRKRGTAAKKPDPPEHDPNDDIPDHKPPPKDDDGDDGGGDDDGSSEEEIDDFEAELRKKRAARKKK